MIPRRNTFFASVDVVRRLPANTHHMRKIQCRWWRACRAVDAHRWPALRWYDALIRRGTGTAAGRRRRPLRYPKAGEFRRDVLWATPVCQGGIYIRVYGRRATLPIEHGPAQTVPAVRFSIPQYGTLQSPFTIRDCGGVNRAAVRRQAACTGHEGTDGRSVQNMRTASDRACAESGMGTIGSCA